MSVIAVVCIVGLLGYCYGISSEYSGNDARASAVKFDRQTDGEIQTKIIVTDMYELLDLFREENLLEKKKADDKVKNDWIYRITLHWDGIFWDQIMINGDPYVLYVGADYLRTEDTYYFAYYDGYYSGDYNLLIKKLDALWEYWSHEL